MRTYTFPRALLLSAGLLALPALAEESENPEPASSRWREYIAKHFELHGYLSTALVVVRNDEGEEQIRSSDQFLRGFREGETFDYRIAALQVRYEPAPRHSFILQLAHRNLADSSITTVEADVTLDWLFYRFQVRENLELSVGRFPVANGLFNKFRDVGVLLPFFRPSYNFYRDGDLVTETVDGVGLAYDRRWTSGWRLEVEGYAGQHTLLEGGTADPIATTREVRVESNLGLQVWLEPPIPGLRLGLGGQRFDVEAMSLFNDDPATWKNWFASVEYLHGALTLRGEFRDIDFPINRPPLVANNDAGVDLSYVQVGYQLNERLSVWGQMEWGRAQQEGSFVPNPRVTFRNRDDTAVSAVYAFNEHLVWKVELHWETFDLAHLELASTEPFAVRFNLARQRTSFAIFSFSISF